MRTPEEIDRARAAYRQLISETRCIADGRNQYASADCRVKAIETLSHLLTSLDVLDWTAGASSGRVEATVKTSHTLRQIEGEQN